MKKLYEKSEIGFAVLCIVVYVVGCSVSDELSRNIGWEKLVTLIFTVVFSAALVLFLRKNGLESKYGLCKPHYPASRFLYYSPLAVLGSVNLWFGVSANFPLAQTLCYMGSMLLVGFLEELIFRGLLFKAMRKDHVRAAMIVSSVTFGLGHIVNLINGSGASVTANLCQIGYAVAIGFLFVLIFERGKSLWPCILTHGVLNALSALSREEALVRYEIPVAVALAVVALGYALILMKNLPKPAEE